MVWGLTGNTEGTEGKERSRRGWLMVIGGWWIVDSENYVMSFLKG